MNTKTAYTIDTIQVHGIDIPVVNHEKKGPMIAHRRLAETLGLAVNTFQKLIERKDMGTCVYNLYTQVTDNQSTQRRELDFLPLRKFEVLINSLNTGHIGKTLPPKERSYLVDKIETLQAEIREVIESYYHDGGAINKKIVPTEKFQDEVVDHIIVNGEAYNEGRIARLLQSLTKSRKITRTITETLIGIAEDHLDNAKSIANKDRRTSHAKRIEDMEEDFSEGIQEYADGRYKKACEALTRVLESHIEATESSRDYAKNEMTGLRKDVKELRSDIKAMDARVSRLERSNEVIIETLGIMNETMRMHNADVIRMIKELTTSRA